MLKPKSDTKPLNLEEKIEWIGTNSSFSTFVSWWLCVGSFYTEVPCA